MKSIFNGRVVNLFMVMFFVIVGTSMTFAGVKDCDDPKWADHPLCTGTDPEPDPDPENPGSLCADSGSFFPAFAYVFTGEIFLSNSEGDCTISIHKAEKTISGVPSNISYRFYGGPAEGDGHGKIAFAQRDGLVNYTLTEILLLEFDIEAGAITTPLPLSPRLIMLEPEGFGNVYAPDLHPDDNKVIVTAYEPGEVRGYIWEFDIPDPGSGYVDSEEDVRELAYLDVNEHQVEHATFHNIRYGMSDQHERVYFGYGIYPQWKLSYIEKEESGNWSLPAVIAERFGGYLGPGSIMEWDYDGSGPREVMAFTNKVDGGDQIEILDVDACVDNTRPCVVIEGIEGWDEASFTTFTEGPLPALLYLHKEDARNIGFSIRECDLTAALQSPNCWTAVSTMDSIFAGSSGGSSPNAPT